MISEQELIILITAVLAMVVFIIVCIRGNKLQLIHKLYLVAAGVLIYWVLALIGMDLAGSSHYQLLRAMEACTYVGVASAPPIGVLIALTFVKGLDHLSWYHYLLFVVPLVTNIMAWTDPYHHLVYQVFSTNSSQAVFGPYLYFSGFYSYVCMAYAVFLLLRFAIKSGSKLYLWQSLLFAVGTMIPGVINSFAILGIANVSIAATPLGFIATIICHGIAIFRFHMLDIKPIALQRVLDWMSDGYLVVADSGLVVNYNQAFHEIFGARYGIEENTFLQACQPQDSEGKAVFYNLLTSIESCRTAQTNISYEQSLIVEQQGQFEKKYYMVEITPLIVEKKIGGFLAFFKDVTKVKESMQRVQDSQARMMEQERLASLGQLVGGIAHNLKTPIMSISGSMIALDHLIDESKQSLGDPEVTPEDYREIYGEMSNWTSRTKDACSYMSDIITAVKEQAVNMNVSERREFSVDDLLKRVNLLLRHELVHSGCKLAVDDHIGDEIILHGDINNMVQVINNLISNAVDAQKKNGGSITIRLDRTAAELLITVRDRGAGIPQEIKPHLFKQMVTSKGSNGTGLGVFISSSVIKGKFEGRMWVEDNPGGGAIFGIGIPIDHVNFKSRQRREPNNYEKE